MNKTKIWLIIAASLILIGAIVFVGVMMVLDWDFTKLSTTTYETNLYEISESFSDISLLTDTADVTFVLSEDGKTRVGCYEQSTVKHSVSVENGMLKIEAVDTRKWHNHIGINFATPKITVFLPKGDCGALLAKSSTGDIKIAKDFSFNSIDVITSTGNVENSASAEGSIKIKPSPGSIKAEHIFADILGVRNTPLNLFGIKQIHPFDSGPLCGVLRAREQISRRVGKHILAHVSRREHIPRQLLGIGQRVGGYHTAVVIRAGGFGQAYFAGRLGRFQQTLKNQVDALKLKFHIVIGNIVRQVFLFVGGL